MRCITPIPPGNMIQIIQHREHICLASSRVDHDGNRCNLSEVWERVSFRLFLFHALEVGLSRPTRPPTSSSIHEIFVALKYYVQNSISGIFVVSQMDSDKVSVRPIRVTLWLPADKLFRNGYAHAARSRSKRSRRRSS